MSVSEVAPIGAANQDDIDNFGQAVENFRPACYQSFDFLPGNSASHQYKKDTLLPLEHRFFLPRILHYTHTLRLAHISTPIFMSKVDAKSAYRRGSI